MLLNPRTDAFLTRISAKLLYGTIILMTVLGSLNHDTLPSNLAVIVTVVLSLLAVAVADTYAYTIYEEMKNRRVTPWRGKWKVFRERSWVMGSTLVPVSFFALASLGVIGQNTAFRLTERVLLFVLLFFGFVTRRLSGGSIFQALSIGVTAAVLGLIVVEIKLWAKYLPEIGY
jgi:hypothetical protein